MVKLHKLGKRTLEDSAPKFCKDFLIVSKTHEGKGYLITCGYAVNYKVPGLMNEILDVVVRLHQRAQKADRLCG